MEEKGEGGREEGKEGGRGEEEEEKELDEECRRPSTSIRPYFPPFS